MTLSNIEIYNLCSVLADVLQNGGNMPVRTSFCLAQNLKTLEPYLASIESVRKIIVDKYTGEDGVLTDGNLEKANREIAELSNVKNEVMLKTIKLADIENSNITAPQMRWLSYIVIEDED